VHESSNIRSPSVAGCGLNCPAAVVNRCPATQTVYAEQKSTNNLPTNKHWFTDNEH
jgi:hypothetical protein